MTARTEHVGRLAKAVGFGHAVSILVRRGLRMSAPVRCRAAGHPIVVRPADSDLFVAGQIFGAHEYEIAAPYLQGLLDLARLAKMRGETPVVIDAGANVGYSALYFADVFADATVLAVEPDPVSFRQLQANCAGHPRIVPIHAAVWKHCEGVNLVGADSSSWARSVADGGLTPSLTLEALVQSVPSARPLVLKLDIEGAEREVTAASPAMVRRFPAILIEPHDFMNPGAACLAPLFEALGGKRVDTLLSGENLMVYDADLVSAPGREDSHDPKRAAADDRTAA